MMIPVVLRILDSRSEICELENQISSKFSTLFWASRNLITTLSVFIPGIKLILASIVLRFQSLSDAWKENLPS